MKRTYYDEVEQEDLLYQLIEDKKQKLKEQEELMPEVTPEQKLTRYVSFILRYVRETYNPHVIVQSKGYDKLKEVVTLRVRRIHSNTNESSERIPLMLEQGSHVIATLNWSCSSYLIMLHL